MKTLSRCAIARYPTPVLTTPDFLSCFGRDSLPLDDQLLLRPVETILFPNSKVELVENIAQSPIWRINTSEYPSDQPLYIDERFVTPASKAPERQLCLPSVSNMLRLLKELIGTRYIWGGNWPQGIPQLLEWYKPRLPIYEDLIRDTWQLKGVDCSGLLYFISDGYTPRNTSELVTFGKGLPIAGKSIDAIASCVAPLDMIVWKGHVILVLDSATAIESRAKVGVVTSPLIARLTEIAQERLAVDEYRPDTPSFTLRRWLPEGYPG